MAYEAYVDLDEQSISNASNVDFLIEFKIAHAPGVLIVLQSLLQISNTQFKRNIAWVAPMLSALSVVDDRSIRSAVKLVYDRHLNPLVIELCLIP